MASDSSADPAASALISTSASANPPSAVPPSNPGASATSSAQNAGAGLSVVLEVTDTGVVVNAGPEFRIFGSGASVEEFVRQYIAVLLLATTVWVRLPVTYDQERDRPMGSDDLWAVQIGEYKPDHYCLRSLWELHLLRLNLSYVVGLLNAAAAGIKTLVVEIDPTRTHAWEEEALRFSDFLKRDMFDDLLRLLNPLFSLRLPGASLSILASNHRTNAPRAAVFPALLASHKHNFLDSLRASLRSTDPPTKPHRHLSALPALVQFTLLAIHSATAYDYGYWCLGALKAHEAGNEIAFARAACNALRAWWLDGAEEALEVSCAGMLLWDALDEAGIEVWQTWLHWQSMSLRQRAAAILPPRPSEP